MKPFVKWAGGKRDLVPKIVTHFPEVCAGKYFEPFLGGGAVFLALKASKRIQKAQLTDKIGELINAWGMVQKKTDALVLELQQYAEKHDPSDSCFFYETRNLDPETLAQFTDVEHAARFIYLNRTCFNGLYRENRKGLFNVPVGRYKNPLICDVTNLHLVAQALQKTSLGVDDFTSALKGVKAGDWVYLDPPYYTEGSNFVGYTAKDFRTPQQLVLAEMFHLLVAKGAHVVVSNSDYPWVREHYAGPRVSLFEVQAPRNVAAKAEDRKPVTELVIVGTPDV
jgi:DNA adenine methylase